MRMRYLCEGFVDGRVTGERVCADGSTGGLYHYTWQNLAYEAFAGMGPVLMPENQTATNRGVVGWGPLPGTRTYAIHYNHLARMLNLLVSVPVMLPMKFQVRVATADSPEVTLGYRDGDGVLGSKKSGVSGGRFAAYGDGVAPSVSVTGWGPWVDWDSSPVNATQSAQGVVGNVPPEYLLDGGVMVVRTSTTNPPAQYRWEPTDPDALEALPPAYRALLVNDPVLFGREIRVRSVVEPTTVSGGTSGTQVHVAGNPPDTVWRVGTGSTALLWEEVALDGTNRCGRIATAGVLYAPALAPSKFPVAGGPTSETYTDYAGGPVSGASLEMLGGNFAVINVPLV